jgi:hypothetical protein
MATSHHAPQFDKRRLEEWLSQVFVPVEPSARFVRHLKARLLHYQGKSVVSGWMLLGAVAMILVLALALLGIAMRVLLLVAGLLGWLGRRRRVRQEVPMTAAGG